MKEFKFACPVCGQHITAVSGTSGSQIECPTCFQKIIVPQERTDDSKLILNAAKADRPRAPQAVVPSEGTGPKRKAKMAWLPAVLLLVMLCAVGAAVYTFRDQLGLHKPSPPPNPPQAEAPKTQPRKTQVPISVNSSWTLEATQAVSPKEPVAGRLKGEAFAVTRTTLVGGTLSIRQGKGWPPELAVAIPFPARRGEDLAGKKVQVEAAQQPPVPKITMRWKNEAGKSQTKTFATGYLLKLEFGKLEAGLIPGTIYLALPDEDQSFLAGTFTADIRPPDPPKQKKPKKSVTSQPPR